MATGDHQVWRWSLRAQIRTLGVLLLATIVLASALAVSLVRHSEAARTATAAAELRAASSTLAARYDRLAEGRTGRGLPPPLDWSDDAVLRSLTASVLTPYAQVEGGFYRVKGETLMGYAYPTYQGSSPKTDIPAAERATILAVARAAVRRAGEVQRRIAAASDVILFEARPLEHGGVAVGGVWLMHRMVGVRAAYRWLNALGLIGLLAVALVATAGAWFLTRRLDAGVARIESALAAMEERLDTAVERTGIAELDRIGGAIEHLARTLHDNQQKRDELEERLKQADRLAALGRLVAAVAHEVRNPLAAIRLRLELTRGTPFDPARVDQTFAVIRAEAERIERLIARLLVLGRAPRPPLAPLDLGRLLSERLAAWQPRAAAQRTALELKCDLAAGAAVRLDRDRLAQIVDNLLVNALDALEESGGCVLVEAAQPSRGEVVVRVTDTGPGLPGEVRDRLFEPFVTNKRDGTGLGLFLSAEMARSLGGAVVHHEPARGAAQDRHGGVPGAADRGWAGPGACFEVRLPC